MEELPDDVRSCLLINGDVDEDIVELDGSGGEEFESLGSLSPRLVS